jgi:oxalate decarboxylase/phosphoglucose isomerase-like protein (cupin superfamily)
MNPIKTAILNGHLTDSELQLVETCRLLYMEGQTNISMLPSLDKNLDLILQLSWIQGALKTDLTFEENESLSQEIFDHICFKRTKQLFADVNAKISLTPADENQVFVENAFTKFNEELYRNVNDKLNIDFSVNRIPFPLEILDPRVVHVAPKKNNELHKHAHETVFVFFSGKGHVLIDDKKIPVQAGSIVFIPRWSMHQSQNDSDEEMIFLAVADFGFTGKAFVGNYLKTARLKTEN